MTGNRKAGLVLQQRDRHLLKELDTMRVMDREQAKRVAGFRSTTRANTRLLALTRAGLLRRVFVGTIFGGRKALYALSPAAVAHIEARHPAFQLRQDQAIVRISLLEHQLHINSVYLTVKYRPIPIAGTSLRRWISFHEPLTQAIALIPDGYLELEQASQIRPMFLEVDLGSEDSRVWEKKAAAYLRLAVSGEFERIFQKPQFRALVVATTDKRMRNIRAAVAKATEKIFWLTTFDNIHRDGFWSSIWLRSTGDQKLPLL